MPPVTRPNQTHGLRYEYHSGDKDLCGKEGNTWDIGGKIRKIFVGKFGNVKRKVK